MTTDADSLAWDWQILKVSSGSREEIAGSSVCLSQPCFEGR